MTETLLDKAKRVAPGRRERNPQSDEILEVALAYLAGAITGRQMCAVMGKHPSQAYNVASQIIFSAIRAGRLKVEKVQP